jgi:hypothetical protein
MIAAPLPRKDWLILSLLGFFLLTACTIELYWVLYADELVVRSRTDLLAYWFRFYGAADNAYYDHVTPFTRALETLNVFVTQWLNLWLVYAILKRKPYRYALQLSLGAYLSYSVLLYFWTAHLSGYQAMRQRSLANFVLLVMPNLPWLLGYLYLAYDSFRAISQRFREDPSGRDRRRPINGWTNEKGVRNLFCPRLPGTSIMG